MVSTWCFTSLNKSRPVSETHHTHSLTGTQCWLGNQKITVGTQCFKHKRHTHQSSRNIVCWVSFVGYISQYCQSCLCFSYLLLASAPCFS